MAVTVANTSPWSEDVWGRARIRVVTVTFDSSYPTGGESLTPNNVGLAEIDFIAVSPDSASVEGYVVQYDYTAQKLQVFVEEAVAAGGALLEIANATDLSAFRVRCLAVGR